MHYKKRKLHKLHSIPIGLCNKEKLYLVSYSIPLSCMVVLLLGLGVMINPSSTLKTSAIEVGDVVGDGDVDNQSTINKSNINKDSIGGSVESLDENSADSGPVDDSFGGYADELEGEMAASSDDGIMPLADTTPTASLIVGGDALDKTVEVGIGEVAYRKHSVSVSVSNMLDYYLVLAGDPNLTLQDKTPTHTIPTVTANVVGASMPENRWGFAWEKNGNTSESALTYKPITTSNTTLESNSALAAGSSVSFNGQLNFAAKFGESTVLGKYSSKVSLSLIATPKTVSTAAQWVNTSGQAIGSGVDTGMMQDITSGFCQSNSNVGTGFTIQLKDARDSNTYKIMKMPDGTCWMVENLRLGNDTAKIPLTANDTDLNGTLKNWTLPASYESENPGKVWNDSGNNEAMVKTGKNLGTNYKAAYGNYYSWCAATAETCMNGTNPLNNTDAPSSICPKGWQLPVGTTGAGSFQNLYNQYPNSTSAGWLTNQTVSYNGGTSAGYSGKRFGVNSADAFFPAAGRVYSNGLNNASSAGYYWSRRAYSYTTRAYYLSFSSSDVLPQNFVDRYYGFSVRCVARY